MAKILADCYGLYVRAGGMIFRPYHSVPSKIHSPHLTVGDGMYQNDNVSAKPVAGAPLCRITNHRLYETWFSHGPAMDDHGPVHSERAWNPVGSKPRVDLDLPVFSPIARERKRTPYVANSMRVFVGDVEVGSIANVVLPELRQGLPPVPLTHVRVRRAASAIIPPPIALPVHAPPRVRTRTRKD